MWRGHRRVWVYNPPTAPIASPSSVSPTLHRSHIHISIYFVSNYLFVSLISPCMCLRVVYWSLVLSQSPPLQAFAAAWTRRRPLPPHPRPRPRPGRPRRPPSRRACATSALRAVSPPTCAWTSLTARTCASAGLAGCRWAVRDAYAREPHDDISSIPGTCTAGPCVSSASDPCRALDGAHS